MSQRIPPNALQACRAEVAAYRELVTQTRNPALFSNSEALRVGRLLAHPVVANVASIAFGSVKADARSGRVEVARRLIAAYKKAISDEPRSPLRRQGEDMWTRILREELPPLLNLVEAEDAQGLAAYLLKFSATYVWFGGVTTSVDGYGWTRNPSLVALLYYDRLVSLADSLGVLPRENPEQGPWGDSVTANVAMLVRKIELEIGASILPPMGAIHTDGLVIPGGVLHYRHLTSLYAALQLPRAGAVCEYGGGLGICGLYARRLGITDYTIYDLPISNLLAGHYLIHAIGDGSVSLYGEAAHHEAIKILPYWECVNAPAKGFATALNQDSMPEIEDGLILAFLREIKRTTRNTFISLNHEAFHPRTVGRFAAQAGGFKRVSRAPSWIREGYVDEVFEISA